MTQHSTRANSPLPNNSPWGRLLKRPWPVQLVLVAALLLAVPFLFNAGSTVHAADNEITGVTLNSLNPGELAITWDTPSDTPDDYRVTWKKSDGKWTSFKKANTVQGGNAFPTGTSHTVTDMEEGTAYQVRVRARYYDGNSNVQNSGPWSEAKEVTVSATPPPPPKKGTEQGEGDPNQDRSTNPPAKPTGLLTGASHDTVILFWTNPNDDDITGYQILRGLDAANLAVLVNDTGNKNTSYTDDTVSASTTYVYAIRARNANGLSPESDTASATTLAPPPEEEEEDTALSTDQTGVIILMDGTARELSFERHEDEDDFNFFTTAGTAYRLSVQMIWPGSASASVSIEAIASGGKAFVFPSSPVVLPGRADFVFTPTSADTISIQIKGIHWGSDSQGRHECGTGNSQTPQADDPIYCYWSSDYTIMVEEVASAAESTSPTTDVCWSYESFPDSLSTPCVMAIEDDVMGYINSQPDRDLWALVQFDEDSGYTVKVHGNVDSNNLLDNVQITLIDQWGIPLTQGKSNTSSSPASVSIGADRTYTGVYFLEVRSRDAAAPIASRSPTEPAESRRRETTTVAAKCQMSTGPATMGLVVISVITDVPARPATATAPAVPVHQRWYFQREQLPMPLQSNTQHWSSRDGFPGGRRIAHRNETRHQGRRRGWTTRHSPARGPGSTKDLQKHAFTATGGSVTRAVRSEKGSDIRWTIHVGSNSSGDVSIGLPAGWTPIATRSGFGLMAGPGPTISAGRPSVKLPGNLGLGHLFTESFQQ